MRTGLAAAAAAAAVFGPPSPGARAARFVSAFGPIHVAPKPMRTFMPGGLHCAQYRSTPLNAVAKERRASPLFNASSESSSAASSVLPIRALLRWITLGAPLWTLLAAGIGMTHPILVQRLFGSLRSVSRSLSILMLAMGMTATPSEVRAALTDRSSQSVVFWNVVCCFILMPLLALGLSSGPMMRCLGLGAQVGPDLVAGTVLLGCVGGGQASNLFALLAGGDISLSVVCTLSTTVLGVVMTPVLTSALLGTTVAMDGISVLRSTASLVLVPLLVGLALGRGLPATAQRFLLPCLPAVGVGATMLLVAGGAANSSSSLLGLGLGSGSSWVPPAICSTLLPLAGGAVALAVAELRGMDKARKRTLVVEVLSKSPTVAYVLALKHFNAAAASVPAAGMVSLAVVGAAVASVWSLPLLNRKDA